MSINKKAAERNGVKCEKNSEENLYKIKAIVLMGILSATYIGLVSIYHLLWYNRPVSSPPGSATLRKDSYRCCRRRS